MQGLRAALLRCYGSLPPSALTLCPQQPQAWPRLLFALAIFHALVLERCKYGSLGWNTKYDFSDGDWLCARHTLSMFLNTPVSLTTCHLPSKAARCPNGQGAPETQNVLCTTAYSGNLDGGFVFGCMTTLPSLLDIQFRCEFDLLALASKVAG